MYHRILNILLATRNSQLEKLLAEVAPLENFSHNFQATTSLDEVDPKEYGIIIVDPAALNQPGIAVIDACRKEQTIIVGCFSAQDFPLLADNHHRFDHVWTTPLNEENIRLSFTRILNQIKAREDAALIEKYLDTLIDSLPDLIWFKDARGSHLKVNTQFCRTVAKTKEQIEGRGHYYIWDLEPDEYAQGEYICLESEEIVLNRKETCLFDETVKCGNELRKFKTYKSPIFDDDGSVIGTVGCAHDVTDLQNLLIELNILIESLPFAVMVCDKDRKITSINQRFIDIFFMARSELIGKVVDSFVDAEGTFTRSKRWIIEQEGETTLLLSKNKVLKVHRENLLDIFGAQAGQIYLFVDVSLEHRQKNKLLIDANTDHLTKLNNRRSLQDFMRKTPCKSGTALLLVDLDNFKEVNDMHGHDEGDRVLVAFADLLRRNFPSESLFRLGGDEFAILLHDIADAGLPREYGEKLITQFTNEMTRQFAHTGVSLSIGIAMDDDENGDKDFGTLFKKADMALYESKNAGKCACTVWAR